MFWLISLILGGLIIGGLGRLAIPGPNPMSIGQTILVGVGGSFVGGLIGRIIFGPNSGSVLLAVLCAAGIVYALQRRNA